ncbi:cilia- and flagella-associated protein [Apis mellifera caucasica]|uniref:Cilia- and flagella-associated protein 100 n=1 Tax=Apis mellifera TaxID=7460 RepID=A0A7M7SRP6_APIME|nr:cilia- and flagella-associated protein 100 [Apis mellifera]KAG6794531.1 cilia- and flagella-associated protein [Apis mellifera caucasica]KAG9429392.1 cilia- and flagella-associated protein [Apis mellifera carnica]|eukprot:XP_026300973.1 cilia- and flagella-associated protein 100 [Apis mellifera]
MSDPTSRACRERHIAQKRRKITVPRKKTLKEFFETQYYFTKGHEYMGEARNVLEEQSPFVYPPCSLMFAYFQYWKAKQRTTDKEKRMLSDTKALHQLLRSLRVDVDIEALEAKKHKDLDEAIAITDVDPRYFSELDARLVREKFSVRKYVEDCREILKYRLLAGQQMDDCIRIDQQFVEEQKRLDKIKRRYRRYISGFEEFLSKDHEESMELLLLAENESKKTREMTDHRNKLSVEYGRVRLEVYHWEESWRMMKMCQRFLYQIAPISWRTEHDWIHRSHSGESITYDHTEDLFGRYRMLGEVASLDALIDFFEQDISDAGPADLYFKEPYELINVFRSIEMQNLNALIHLESLAEPMAQMMTTIQNAEQQIKLEIGEITNTINELRESIHVLENRAVDLEKHANELLETVFRDSVCSEEVLRLQVFVEDAYESCVGPNEANLDSFSMMKWIEKIHDDLNLKLDTLPPEVVKACEKEGFKQELKVMKQTEEAAKKFELMHRLLASLKRIMEPPPTKKRPMMWRSIPKTYRLKGVAMALEPTEEEMQYLTFFTDYCKTEDFTTYRPQFPDDFDLTFKKQEIVVTETEEDEDVLIKKFE